MDDERIEVMRLMLQEGSELLGRMNDRVDALKSKNMNFLATILTVVALIAGGLFFAVEQGWLPAVHLLLSALFFAPAIWTSYLCHTLFRPRAYPELTTYDDPNLNLIMNAPLEQVLSHLIFRKREVLWALEKRYSAELTIHRESFGWFVGSLVGLLMFLSLELLSI